MNYKTFNYKNYKECWFEVGNYATLNKPMYIQICNKIDGDIITATVNMPGYFYLPNTTTIKNYSENSGITRFLKKLGVVNEVYSSSKINLFATNNETVDLCEINIENLKKYSKEFNYKYTY